MNLFKNIKKLVTDHKVETIVVGGTIVAGGLLFYVTKTMGISDYHFNAEEMVKDRLLKYVPFSDMSKEEAIEMMKKAINNEVEMIDAQVYESDGQASLWFNLR